MPLLPNLFPPSKGDSRQDEGIGTKLKLDLQSLPPHLLYGLGTASAFAAFFTYRRYFKRIPNAEWITPSHVSNKRWIKGFVTSVGDADNFRLYHAPGFGWSWPLKFRSVPSMSKELKDNTIHIRIAGADAPEAAHFGRPSQPYSAEALAWLKSSIEGKKVYCQLMRRDQYGRIISHVVRPPLLLPGSLFSGKILSLEMIKAGWATTYEQAGAEYGKWGKDTFLRLEQEAKIAQRGMWKDGVKPIETPAEYKRRYASAAQAADVVEKVVKQPGKKRPWWRRLFSKS